MTCGKNGGRYICIGCKYLAMLFRAFSCGLAKFANLGTICRFGQLIANWAIFANLAIFANSGNRLRIRAMELPVDYIKVLHFEVTWGNAFAQIGNQLPKSAINCPNWQSIARIGNRLPELANIARIGKLCQTTWKGP